MAKSKSTKRELVEIEEPSEPKQEFKRRAKIQKVKAMAEDELMTDAGIEPSHHGLVSPTSPPGRTNHLIPGNQDNTMGDEARRLDRSAAPSLRMSPAPQASGMRIVGSRVKVLVDAINDFRKLGVDNVVTLPELVLIGDQSAGKSSLMGALAEIHLPRSSGCCTRCPAHIKTSPALQWNCKISLQKQYSYEPKAGKLLDPKDVTRSHPFPPWVELASSEIKQFKTIYHKNDLEEVLKWAQIATLNPDTEHTRYVPGHENFLDDESTQAKFSPNVVSVEISGPGLPSLSFYDLPGIFQNAGHKEDQYLVKVIENLAAKYIKHPEALIICALPMSADPATSRTAKVISDLKADKRCIGVLTKADQLQEGQSYEEFFKLLQGREHVVGHGYYVTKQPVQSANDKAVLNYHKNARDQEEHFFRTNYPWCKDWDQFRDRFGTINLQLALSQKFAQQIAASIPLFQIKINQRTKELDQELAGLPDLPDKNILVQVLQKLGHFSNEICSLLDGGSFRNGFQSYWKKLCRQFSDTIIIMKPVIIISHSSDDVVPEVISIDDDSASEDTAVTDNPETPTRNPKMPNHVPNMNATPSNRMNGNQLLQGIKEDTPSQGSPARKVSVMPEVGPFLQFLTQTEKEKAERKISLEDIRATIQKHAHTGIPGLVNCQTHSELCMKTIKPWEPPMEIFLDLTLSKLRDEMEAILNDVLGQWKQTELYKLAFQHLNAFIDKFELEQRDVFSKIYAREAYKLFTVNEAALREAQMKEIKELKDARRKRRVNLFIKKNELLGFKYPEKKVTDQDLGEDSLKAEIDVAGYVRGYYLTAARRFIDNVCHSMDADFFRTAKMDISFFLEGQLGIVSDNGGGEERCRELMEEDSKVAERRACLRQEKIKLQLFTDRLLQLVHDEEALTAEVERINGSTDDLAERGV